MPLLLFISPSFYSSGPAHLQGLLSVICTGRPSYGSGDTPYLCPQIERREHSEVLVSPRLDE